MKEALRILRQAARLPRAVRAWLLPCLLVLAGLAAAQTAGPASQQMPATRMAGGPANFVLHTAFWRDTSGQAGLEQARAQVFQPYTGVFNQGYTDDVHWVQVRLAPSATDLALLVQPAWLDDLTLFDPAQPGPPRTVGDRHPEELNAFHGLGLSFVVPGSDQPRDLWLRLKTTSVHRLDLQAVPVPQVQEALAQDLTWSALYISTLLLMLVVLLVVWLIQRERVLGTFVLRHAVFTFYAASFLGLPALLASEWVPAPYFDRSLSLVILLTLPTGLWFDITLLSTYKPNRHLLRLLWVIGACSPVLFGLYLLGHERLALQTNIHLLTVASVGIFLTALSTRPDPDVQQLLPKKVMVAYYLFILGGLLTGLVALMGWTQPRWLGLNLLLLHGLVSALVMMTLLYLRAQRHMHLTRQMGWQLRKAQEEVEFEQRRRQEQSQFLHMLMHELKTPLSVVSMALGTRDNKEKNLQMAGRAVQDMKAVIERCVQADQMGEMVMTPRAQALDLGQEIGRAVEALAQPHERLVLELGPALQLHTDAQLLQTVLANLLDNALRYGDPLSPVRVRAEAAPHQGREGVCLRIGNTPGLSGWPDPQRIFGKYYRASGAHRESGSGLGLYLSRQLAATLGGHLLYAPTDTLVQFELWIPQTPA